MKQQIIDVREKVAKDEIVMNDTINVLLIYI